MTLDIEPTYDVAQEVHARPAVGGGAGAPRRDHEQRRLREPLHRLDRRHRRAGLAQDARDAGLRGCATELFGATPADGPRHPLPGIDPVNCTAQLGEPGPWHDRLPHFRMDFTPSNGDELQSEFLVPRAHAVAAMEAIRALSDRIAPLLQVTEVRTIAGDDLWLSTRAGRRPRRPALHLAPAAARGRGPAADDRGRAGPVRRATALGQALRRRGPRPRPPVPALGRLPLPGRAARTPTASSATTSWTATSSRTRNVRGCARYDARLLGRRRSRPPAGHLRRRGPCRPRGPSARASRPRCRAAAAGRSRTAPPAAASADTSPASAATSSSAISSASAVELVGGRRRLRQRVPPHVPEQQLVALPVRQLGHHVARARTPVRTAPASRGRRRRWTRRARRDGGPATPRPPSRTVPRARSPCRASRSRTSSRPCRARGRTAPSATRPSTRRPRGRGGTPGGSSPRTRPGCAPGSRARAAPRRRPGCGRGSSRRSAARALGRQSSGPADAPLRLVEHVGRASAGRCPRPDPGPAARRRPGSARPTEQAARCSAPGSVATAGEQRGVRAGVGERAVAGVRGEIGHAAQPGVCPWGRVKRPAARRARRRPRPTTAPGRSPAPARPAARPPDANQVSSATYAPMISRVPAVGRGDRHVGHRLRRLLPQDDLRRPGRSAPRTARTSRSDRRRRDRPRRGTAPRTRSRTSHRRRRGTRGAPARPTANDATRSSCATWRRTVATVRAGTASTTTSSTPNRPGSDVRPAHPSDRSTRSSSGPRSARSRRRPSHHDRMAARLTRRLREHVGDRAERHLEPPQQRDRVRVRPAGPRS